MAVMGKISEDAQRNNKTTDDLHRALRDGIEGISDANLTRIMICLDRYIEARVSERHTY